ncbi:EpsG family protein [Oceanisphaera pacifica]|nr:EpsG family protein [Oceanisphaera pacifica]
MTSRFVINFISFFVFGVISVWLFTEVTVKAETYDSLVYYYFYNIISDKGLLDFILEHYDSAGKVEPGIYIFYSFFPSDLSVYSFVFINYFIILFFCYFLYFSLSFFQVKKDFLSPFFVILLIFYWYPNYMSLLWFWRNFLAVLVMSAAAFFIFNRRNFTGFFGVVLSLLFHYSSISYLVALLFSQPVVRACKIFNIYFSVFLAFAIGAFFGVFISFFIGFLAFFASGSGEWTANNNLVGGVVVLYMLSIQLCFLSCANKIKKHYNIYLFLLCIMFFVSGVSLSFFNNYFVVNRLLLMTSILFVPLFVLYRTYLTKLLLLLVSMLLLLGVLMTSKSLYGYLVFSN